MASQQTDYAVTMQGITLAFQPGIGIFDVDLDVPAGRIFGLIGPSGCGKTTLLRVMLGLLTPDAGTITVLGHDQENMKHSIEKQVGYMPQAFALYPNLSVNENLHFVASLYGIDLFSRRQHIEQSLQLVELTDARSRLVRNLSGGMRRRLLLAGTLLHDPDLIVADEPTGGIDPVLRRKLWDHFEHLRDQGKTLFITTQYVEEAAYCDVVGVMDQGRLLMVDTPQGLRRRAQRGEVVVLRVAAAQEQAAMAACEDLPGINDIYRIPDVPGTLHLHVENAAEIIPAVIEASQASDIQIDQIEEHHLRFNEVFYKLLEEKGTDA